MFTDSAVRKLQDRMDALEKETALAKLMAAAAKQENIVLRRKLANKGKGSPGTAATEDNVVARFYRTEKGSAGYAIHASNTIALNDWDLSTIMGTQWFAGSVEHRCVMAMLSQHKADTGDTVTRQEWMDLQVPQQDELDV